MARRPIEKKLIETLKENELDFILRGIYPIQDIYEHIKNRYPHLCEDDYLCNQHCANGVKQPEWKHTVRSFLSSYNRNNKIQKIPERGVWELR